MRKIGILLVISTIFLAQRNLAQTEGYAPKITPIPPSSFQFIKYGEIPVNEYTGIPNISIPIYTIKDGDLEMPIILNYHAGGIRVSEEASWVGLGWNLDVGNVTQIVNDRDDFMTKDPTNGSPITKLQPDYYYYPYTTTPFRFSWRWNYPLNSISYPFGNPISTVGITKDQPWHSFVVFMNYDVPVNGSCDTKYPQMFNAGTNGNDYIDSEPDVFKASFFGHYLEFVIDFKTGLIDVLNKKNYKIDQTANSAGKVTWKITAPDGIQYFFEEIEENYSQYSNTHIKAVDYGNYQVQLLSRVWHITKIISPTNRTISFTWQKTTSINELPSFSQKNKNKTFIGTIPEGAGYSNAVEDINGGDGIVSELVPSYSFSTSQARVHSYLKTIQFSLGTITFSTSSRSDINGDIKLDSIVIANNNSQIVKQFNFGYNYFVGNHDGGCSDKDYGSFYSNKSLTELTYRLKLNSLQEVGQPAYTFTYNVTTLPSKTSYAADYWGFYNGKTSNTSLIPNPVHIGKPELGDNGNDRNANLTYAKAGTLEQIQYPTGGTTNFEYELNTFQNSLYNSISTGCGLRINNQTNWIGTTRIQKLKYTYEGGQCMQPLNFYGAYSYKHLVYDPNVQCYGDHLTEYSFNVWYISGNNFYTSSLLGSGNYTGYYKVTKELLDNNDVNDGKVVSYYSNYPDIGAHLDFQDMSLPARKNQYEPDNGSLLLQTIFNRSGDSISNKMNSYEFLMSDVFYGAKTTFSNLWAISFTQSGTGCDILYPYEQDLVGYYPLYSGESLLTSAKVNNFFNGNTVTTKTDYYYNTKNQLTTTNTMNSKGEILIKGYSYPSDCTDPYMSDLRARNILNHPVGIADLKNGEILFNKIEKYNNYNGLILVNSISDAAYLNPLEDRIFFDQYDNLGNPLQFHTSNNINTAYIWGYNNTLLVAKIVNAVNGQAAYTSFESWQDLGGWSCSGTILNSSPAKTGRSYMLITGAGSITKSVAAGTYFIEYWAKSPISVSGGTVTDISSSSQDANGWMFYMKKVVITATTTLALSGTTPIDELRLYPSNAQMTTYTYDPLIGMTSSTDENNVTTYYTYDTFGRLQEVKDADGNVLKHYEYHYTGQTVN